MHKLSRFGTHNTPTRLTARAVRTELVITVRILRRASYRVSSALTSRREFRDGLKSHLFADAYF